MRTTLFRQHALEHQHQRLPGDVLLTPKLSYAVITGIVVVWVVVVIYFLCTQQYSRHAAVTGWLEPDGGHVRLNATRQGLVTRIFVDEGVYVEAGTAVLALDEAEQLRSGISAPEKQIEQLNNQASRLASQQRHLDKVFGQKRQNAQQRVASLTQELKTLQSVIMLAEQRATLADTQRQGMLRLQKEGYIPGRDVSLSTSETLQLQQEIKQLRREQGSLTRQYNEATSTLNALPDEHAQQRLGLDNQYSELQQRIVQLQSQRSSVIVAPRDGTVSHIDTHQGQQLAPGQAIMTLTPTNATIEAKMVVPVRAAGFLSEGQRVAIRYDAFPYQKYGLHEGHITSISNTLVLPGDWPDAPVSLQEPGYLVRVRLLSDTLNAHGNAIRLKSGMTFSADVHLGDRSLVEWLLEPLLSITGRL